MAGLLSPPGRAVLDEIHEVVGVEQAQPALFSLPAPGRLLVSADSGAWVVEQDGSKRLLGSYLEASWSPFGRFVVASRRNELVALTPEGDVRWSLARPGVTFPRWGGTKTDTRIAYLSRGDELRAVGGNGKGDHVIDRGVAARAPLWRAGRGHVLVYAKRDGSIRAVNVDTGAVLDRKAPGTLLREADEAAVRRVLGTGDFAAPVRSPDGRWLAVGWPEADQLVFVPDGRRPAAPGGLERVEPVSLAVVSYDRRMVLRALIVVALLAAPAEPLGRSYEGRPIDVVHVAGPGTRILVVGCIHGNECEGIEVTTLLARSHPQADLWLIHQLNPDGYARRSRLNAHGVDLNRDFVAATQRETRIARRLVLRIRPDVTIWFHQPQAVVRAWGPSRTIARRYARLAGAPYRTLLWPPGSASRWQNGLGQRSFVVELGAGELANVVARRHAEAVLRLSE